MMYITAPFVSIGPTKNNEIHKLYIIGFYITMNTKAVVY